MVLAAYELAVSRLFPATGDSIPGPIFFDSHIRRRRLLWLWWAWGSGSKVPSGHIFSILDLGRVCLVSSSALLLIGGVWFFDVIVGGADSGVKSKISF